MQSKDTEHWDTIIRPKRKLFAFNLNEIWRYRDLLMLFVKRDFITFYKQTILGPLWFFLQPIFTSIVFIFIFSRLVGLSTDSLPPLVFYLAGITCWNYFSECIAKTSTVFKDSVAIFGKVYFPRLIAPLSIVISNLLKFAVQLLLLLAVTVYYASTGFSFDTSWSIILVFPILIFLMASLGLGLGLIITALTTRYRDLSFLVTFGVQLLMYATTVIYPLSAAPPKYKHLIALNPMTSIIEAFRYTLFGKGEFSLTSLGYSAACSILILFFGIIIFNRTEKSFIDTI